MIELESPRWHELRHAYGPASDVPALLRLLPMAAGRRDTNAEPFFSLWSALCHQSDVYPASYAAVPHLVAVAAAHQPADRAECLLLAGSIESFRHKPNSPPIPQDLIASYNAALQEAVALSLESLAEEPDQTCFQGLLGALAAFRGFPQLAAAVTDLERELMCPRCDSPFVIPGYLYFA